MTKKHSQLLSNRKLLLTSKFNLLRRYARSGHYEKLTRDNCWGALKWESEQNPDYKKGQLKETKWVWGFVDELLGVNVKDDKGEEIKTNFEPENGQLRWFTETRDKYRAFDVPDKVEKIEEAELNEDLELDKPKKNVKI